MAQWALLDDGYIASDDQQIGVMSLREFIEYVNELEWELTCQRIRKKMPFMERIYGQSMNSLK